jgi:hypothetical protein
LGDITQIYRPGGYGRWPNGCHTADAKNRKYITFDEAIDV